VVRDLVTKVDSMEKVEGSPEPPWIVPFVGAKRNIILS
jgi:hypothetical protein